MLFFANWLENAFTHIKYASISMQSSMYLAVSGFLHIHHYVHVLYDTVYFARMCVRVEEPLECRLSPTLGSQIKGDLTSSTRLQSPLLLAALSEL